MEGMEIFKTWIMPPLVGAVIGYFTNWLAIKMLFRPLAPVYLGKLRLPFTPGILPRERHRLTESIGSTVSTELLTPQVFKSRLGDEALAQKLSESIEILLSGMMETPAAELAESLRGQGSGQGKPPSETQALLGSLARNFLGSEEFRRALDGAFSSLAEELAALKLEDFVGRERFSALVSAFLDRFGPKASRENLSAFIDGLAAGLAGRDGGTSGTSPSQASGLFPSEALKPLALFGARTLYDNLLPPLEALLASQETRAKLEASAMELVRSAISRLGTVQRLIVGVANYEKTLEDTMPQTIDDFSRQLMGVLREKTAKEGIVEAMAVHLLRGGGKGNLPLLAGTTPEGVAWAVHEPEPGKSALFGILPLDALKEAAIGFFAGLEGDREGFLLRASEKYGALGSRPLGDVFPGLSASLLGAFRRLGAMEAMDRRDEGSKPAGMSLAGPALDSFFLALGSAAEGKSIGQLLGMDRSAYQVLSRSLAKVIVKAVADQADRLVEALDIRTMVVERIEALDMAEVERLILKVVKDELQWITLIGGILGAAIGLVQSFLSLL